MIADAPGIAGSLFPSRYIAHALLRDARLADDRSTARLTRDLPRWWSRVESSCGPATGIRALFDLAAMPLFAMLGFRASRAVFERDSATARLSTGRGTAVSLLILPWSHRPSGAWRAAVQTARDHDAAWCFVFAPPYLSLLPARGAAIRRSVDFVFPDACHAPSVSRLLILARAEAFEPGAAAAAEIDRLVEAGARFQDRVRTDLQHGVIQALGALTPVMGTTIGDAEGSPFEQALTVLYRVLFLLFAESRDLLPRYHPIYRDGYAVVTLCRQAAAAVPARGLWEALAAATRLSRMGCQIEDLHVPAFNGRLFAREAAPALEARRSLGRPTAESIGRDRAMQEALASLASRPTRAGREEICYADLGVEQLGAVYERVLDIEPNHRTIEPSKHRTIEPSNHRRSARLHSDRRKQTGTFYTPQDLTDLVVGRTLGRLVSGRSADEVLALRVVDPAMGSGAFLVAACRYLADAYERALIEDGRCTTADISPDERSGFRRLVAERCLAGVDANPIAVQLARLSLWLATLSTGKPLSFLDHRLRVGNSLVGAWPDDLRQVTDRRAGAAALPLFEHIDLHDSLRDAVRPLQALLGRPDDSVADVRAKEAAWTRLCGDRSPLSPWRLAADLWCARWFWQGGAPPSAAECRAAMDGILRGDATLGAAHLSRLLQGAASAREAHRFFHWPLEFADIFYDDQGQPKEQPGFDAVVGNPPWEMLRDDGREGAEVGARSTLRFIRGCSAYASCARGHMNLYQPFLERSLRLVRAGGRIGLVLPWGLASDEGAAALRQRLMSQTRLDAIVGFDNAHGLFPIHRSFRFLAIVTTAGGSTQEFSATFGVKTRDEIAGLPDEGALRLSAAAIARIGGPSLRIPHVTRARDLDLLEESAGRFPRLGGSEGWNVRFGRELNVTEDRSSFTSRGLPVLEGKHVHPFVVNTDTAFRIPQTVAARLLPSGSFSTPRLAYRDVAGVTNRLSLIAAVVPADVVTTHTLFCLRTPVPVERQHFLSGVFNSYVLNAIVRMLMGSHLTTGLIEDLPVPAWRDASIFRRIARLAARFASRPGDDRTAARLQALVGQLYGLDEDTFAAVLEGFPLVPAREREAARAAFGHIARAVAL